MLRAVSMGLFSHKYTVYDGGARIAYIHTAWFGDRADLTVAGEDYQIRRRKFPLCGFLMENGEQVLAVAEKVKFLRSFRVKLSGREFKLTAASPFTRRFELYENNGLVGAIGPESWMARTATIRLPSDIPATVQVFLFWLVSILWRGSRGTALAFGPP